MHSFFLLSSHLRKFPIVFMTNSTTCIPDGLFASTTLFHHLHFLDHFISLLSILHAEAWDCVLTFFHLFETFQWLPPLRTKLKFLTMAYNTINGLQQRQYQLPKGNFWRHFFMCHKTRELLLTFSGQGLKGPKRPRMCGKVPHSSVFSLTVGDLQLSYRVLM